MNSRNTISFQNPGVLDPRGYKLFGASAKTGSNPIGFFGTGLKYSIAIWLRMGCTVDIWHGLDRVQFAVTAIKMRDSEFAVVTANGDELGFTTELGKTWKPWQAMREMWCNAIDEGGEMKFAALEPKEGYTTIHVCGLAAAEAWNDRHGIILEGSPDWISEGVEIHRKRSKAIYYRGIRVKDLERASDLTYNIVGRSLDLTEDRTIKYDFYASAFIRDALLSTSDRVLANCLLNVPRDCYEDRLDFESGNMGSVLADLIAEGDRKKHIRNGSLVKCYHNRTGTDDVPEPCAELSEVEVQQLEIAKLFCRSMGLAVDRYPVTVSADLVDSVLGRAYRNSSTIVLNRRVFMSGTKMVAGTLMEEVIHLQHGLDDETRTLQNFLVDMVVTEYERRIGEPL